MKRLIGGLVFTVMIIATVTGCTSMKNSAYGYKTVDEWKQSSSTTDTGVNEEISGHYNQEVEAICSNGRFVGSHEGDVSTWLGVPYASYSTKSGNDRELNDSTLSDNDSKASPLPQSNKIYEAYFYGDDVVSTDISAGHYSGDDVVSTDISAGDVNSNGEKLLTLNVWSNTSSIRNNKPVLVYFPGEAEINGDITNYRYNGHYFAENNEEMMIVTVDYRNMDASVAGSDEAMSDQIAALKWINQNIDAFGGDADNITIAGGSSAIRLCTNTEANRLFDKAWIMSGDVVASSDVTDVGNSATDADGNSLSNVITSSNLSDSMSSAWGDGTTKNLSIVYSYTTNEMSFLLDKIWATREEGIKYCQDTYNNYFANASEEKLKLKQQYEQAIIAEGYNQSDIPIIFMNDYLFQVPIKSMLSYHIASGGEGYLMEFDMPYDKPEDYEAGHGIDIYYLFGSLDGESVVGTMQEMKMIRTYQNYLSEFCRNGSPGYSGHSWKAFTESKQYTLLFDEMYDQGRERFEVRHNLFEEFSRV